MNAIALLLALAAQPADEPASQPAAPPPPQAQAGGSAADIQGQVTWIFEVDEKQIKIQESWNFNNESGRIVPKDQLHFPLPDGTKRVNLDEGTVGFEAAENGSEIYATEAFAPGPKTLAGAFLFEFSGSSTVLRRTFPVRVVGARLIIENIQNLEVTANVEIDKRVRDLNGLEFQVVNIAPMSAGDTLELRFDGLPSRTSWPRRLAVVIAIAIVGWAIWMLRRPSQEGHEKLGPLSAQARRDRIVKAIELLERDHAEDKIKEKRYERRHEELMAELAAVMREIDLAG